VALYRKYRPATFAEVFHQALESFLFAAAWDKTELFGEPMQHTDIRNLHAES